MNTSNLDFQRYTEQRYIDIKLLENRTDIIQIIQAGQNQTDKRIDELRAEIKEVRTKLSAEIKEVHTLISNNQKSNTAILITVIIGFIGMIVAIFSGFAGVFSFGG